VYVAAALASNATTIGSLCLGTLLLVSVALLGICNSLTRELRMCGCRVYVTEPPKKYARRLDMARELIGEMGKSDWAVNMGLVRLEDVGALPAPSDGASGRDMRALTSRVVV
jgi:hypothetical protein